MEQLQLFDTQLQHAKFLICLRSIEAAGGNFCKAARALGIHRNTLTRIMRASGYGKKAVSKLIRERKKLNECTENVSRAPGWGSDVLCPMPDGMGFERSRAAGMSKKPGRETVLTLRNGTDNG